LFLQLAEHLVIDLSSGLSWMVLTNAGIVTFCCVRSGKLLNRTAEMGANAAEGRGYCGGEGRSGTNACESELKEPLKNTSEAAEKYSLRT
jgi:hypothetical protein